MKPFIFTFIIIILFSSSFELRGQASLTGKKWIIAEAGISDDLKYGLNPNIKPLVVFYNKDSANNKIDYSKIEFHFLATGAYQATNNKGTIYNGTWSLNTAGDSLTTDDTLRYRFNFIDVSNCIAKNGKSQVIDTVGTLDTLYSYLKLYGVPDITAVNENENGFVKLYPMPVKEIVSIEFSSKNYTEARLYNLFGQLVKTIPIQHKTAIQLNMQEMPAGYYSLEVISQDGERVVKKVIKE